MCNPLVWLCGWNTCSSFNTPFVLYFFSSIWHVMGLKWSKYSSPVVLESRGSVAQVSEYNRADNKRAAKGASKTETHSLAKLLNRYSSTPQISKNPPSLIWELRSARRTGGKIPRIQMGGAKESAKVVYRGASHARKSSVTQEWVYVVAGFSLSSSHFDTSLLIPKR